MITINFKNGEKEYKKAIEAHPNLVNLDRPELFVKMLRQEIKK